MAFIKACLHISFMNLRKWLTTPRLYILIFLLFIILYEPCAEIYEYSSAIQLKTPPWVFLFIMDTQYRRIFIMFGAVMLFCDAPFLDKVQPYIIVRSKKSNWVLGQFMYIMFAAALYLIFIYIITILLTIPVINFDNDWGKIFISLGYAPRLRSISISSYIIGAYTPFWALLQTLTLNWLLFVFLGMLMFNINLVFPHAVGSIVAVALILLGVERLPKLSWILPTTMSWLSLLDTSFSFKNPSIIYSYIYFLFLIFLLLGLSHYLILRKAIETAPIL